MKKLILVVFLLLPFLGKGQKNTKITIIDADTKSAIVDVAVFNKNSDKHYFSDENGQVYIENLEKTDTILITHISYAITLKTAFNNLSEVIEIYRKTIIMPELRVLPISAMNIIDKAVEFLPINYSIHSHQYILSIDHLVNSENKIVKRFLGEIGSEFCVFSKTYDQDYFGISTNQFIDNRKSMNFNVGYNFSNTNIENIINLSFLNELDVISNKKKYAFTFTENVGNSPYWEINYIPKNANKENNLVGTIFIDKINYAIVKIVIKNSPDVEIKSKWHVIGSGKLEKANLEGTHFLINTKSEITFIKEADKYKLQFIKNESKYVFKQEHKKMTYETITDIVVLKRVLPLNEFKKINMYSFQLKYKDQNRISNSYVSRRIEQKLEKLKIKYPDLDVN